MLSLCRLKDVGKNDHHSDEALYGNLCSICLTSKGRHRIKHGMRRSILWLIALILETVPLWDVSIADILYVGNKAEVRIHTEDIVHDACKSLIINAEFARSNPVNSSHCLPSMHTGGACPMP